MANHAYNMDYIADKDTFKAVMYACSLLRKGCSYTKAIGVACNYYDANPNDVRHFVSQRSGRTRANKNASKYTKER